MTTLSPTAFATALQWLHLDTQRGAAITLGEGILEIHFDGGIEVATENHRALAESLAATVDAHTANALQQERATIEQVLRSLLREIVPGSPMVRMTRDLAFNTGIEIALKELGFDPK